MGGDACHHVAEFRPSKYLLLLDSILHNPFSKSSSSLCPGSLFNDLLLGGDKTKPFFGIADLLDGKSITYNFDDVVRTIGKVQDADAREEILVVMAHDESLLEVVDFFPKEANGFVEKEWVKEGRWGFWKDFKESVKHSLFRKET